MKNYYWNTESWGDAYTPEDADLAIFLANEILSATSERHPNWDDETMAYASQVLWNNYCTKGIKYLETLLDHQHENEREEN